MRHPTNFIASIILVCVNFKWSCSFIVPSGRSFFFSNAPVQRTLLEEYQHHRYDDRLYIVRLSFTGTSSQFMEATDFKELYFKQNAVLFKDPRNHPQKIKKLTRLLLHSKNDDSKLSIDSKEERMMNDGISLAFFSFLIICFNLYFNTVTSIIFDGLFVVFQIFMNQLEHGYDDDLQDDEIQFNLHEEESNEWTISKPIRNSLLFLASAISSLLLSPMGVAVRTNDGIHSDPSSSMSVLTYPLILVGIMSGISIYFLLNTKMNIDANRNGALNDKDVSVDSLSRRQLEKWDDAFQHFTTKTDGDDGISK